MSDNGNFQLGDQILDIPPESIQIRRSPFNLEWQTLRTKSSMKVKSGFSQIDIQLLVKFTDDSFSQDNLGTPINGFDKLRKLIAQLRVTPFCFAENIHLRESILGGATDQTMALACRQITISKEDNTTNVLTVCFLFNWFNYFPFTKSFSFKPDIFIPSEVKNPTQSAAFRLMYNAELLRNKYDSAPSVLNNSDITFKFDEFKQLPYDSYQKGKSQFQALQKLQKQLQDALDQQLLKNVTTYNRVENDNTFYSSATPDVVGHYSTLDKTASSYSSNSNALQNLLIKSLSDSLVDGSWAQQFEYELFGNTTSIANADIDSVMKIVNGQINSDNYEIFSDPNWKTINLPALGTVKLDKQIGPQPDRSLRTGLETFKTGQTILLAKTHNFDLVSSFLIPTGITISFENVLATIPMVGYMFPAYQYLGATTVRVSLSLMAAPTPNDPDAGEEGLTSISAFVNMCEQQAHTYRLIPAGHRNITVTNQIMNMLGLHNFITGNLTTSTVEGSPGTFAITLDLLEDPLTPETLEKFTASGSFITTEEIRVATAQIVESKLKTITSIVNQNGKFIFLNGEKTVKPLYPEGKMQGETFFGTPAFATVTPEMANKTIEGDTLYFAYSGTADLQHARFQSIVTEYGSILSNFLTDVANAIQEPAVQSQLSDFTKLNNNDCIGIEKVLEVLKPLTDSLLKNPPEMSNQSTGEITTAEKIALGVTAAINPLVALAGAGAAYGGATLYDTIHNGSATSLGDALNSWRETVRTFIDKIINGPALDLPEFHPIQDLQTQSALNAATDCYPDFPLSYCLQILQQDRPDIYKQLKTAYQKGGAGLKNVPLSSILNPDFYFYNPQIDNLAEIIPSTVLNAAGAAVISARKAQVGLEKDFFGGIYKDAFNDTAAIPGNYISNLDQKVTQDLNADEYKYTAAGKAYASSVMNNWTNGYYVMPPCLNGNLFPALVQANGFPQTNNNKDDNDKIITTMDDGAAKIKTVTLPSVDPTAKDTNGKLPNGNFNTGLNKRAAKDCVLKVDNLVTPTGACSCVHTFDVASLFQPLPENAYMATPSVAVQAWPDMALQEVTNGTVTVSYKGTNQIIHLYPIDSLGHVLDEWPARFFSSMAQDAASAGITLQVNSAYRSKEQQQQLYNLYQNWLTCKNNGTPWTGNIPSPANPPGKSKHEIGLAVDIQTNGADQGQPSAIYDWLTKNASRYGFFPIGGELEQHHWQYDPSFTTQVSSSVGIVPHVDVPNDSLFSKSVDQFKKELDQHGYSMMRAYPTFKLYFIESDEGERRRYGYDDFFQYSAVKEIEVVRSRKLPADLCNIQLTNISGVLSNRRFAGANNPGAVMNGDTETHEAPLSAASKTNTAQENPFTSLMLTPGMQIQLRLGYDNNPDNLETVFNGIVTEITPISDTGNDLINITCQSFALELIQNIQGSVKKIGGFLSGSGRTFKICEELLSYPEVIHFGHWEPGPGGGYGANAFRPLLTKRWVPWASPQHDNIFAPQGDTALGLVDEFSSTVPYTMYQTTIWDTLQELTLRCPGMICSAVPYKGEWGDRMTLFFGLPDQMYFARDPTSKEKDTANTLQNLTSYNLTPAEMLGDATGNPDIEAIWADLKEPSNSKDQRDKYLTMLIAKIGLNQGVTKPFRNYHVLTSAMHILGNFITVSTHNTFNTATVQYGNSNPVVQNATQNLDFSDPDSFTLKGDETISDEEVRELYASYPNCVGYEMAKNYAVSLLYNSFKDGYKGSIVVIGNPTIKPFDVAYIFDEYTDMYGPIEVEQVIHRISQETGFVTEITPDMCLDVNNWSTVSTRDAMGLISEAALKSIGMPSLTGIPGAAVVGNAVDTVAGLEIGLGATALSHLPFIGSAFSPIANDFWNSSTNTLGKNNSGSSAVGLIGTFVGKWAVTRSQLAHPFRFHPLVLSGNVLLGGMPNKKPGGLSNLYTQYISEPYKDAKEGFPLLVQDTWQTMDPNNWWGKWQGDFTW